MANSSAADKHPQARLLNPWALLPVALGVALVLWLTFNSEEVFMPSGDGEPDAVSVNYAELLLQAHPENDALRLTLIDLLVKLGDFEQARHHLARLRGKDRLATPFYEVELDILGALARPEGMDEEQTRRLLERLRKIEHVSLNDAMLERLARHALALDAPDLAARTFAELAGRDPQGRQRWLDEAARWYLASGERRRRRTSSGNWPKRKPSRRSAWPICARPSPACSLASAANRRRCCWTSGWTPCRRMNRPWPGSPRAYAPPKAASATTWPNASSGAGANCAPRTMRRWPPTCV